MEPTNTANSANTNATLAGAAKALVNPSQPTDMTKSTGDANMKVYELAKELGLDSISLLDKLSELNIKVKNHMSDLTLEQVQTAKERMAAANAPSKTTATKAGAKTTTKKAAPTTASTAAAAAPKKTSGLLKKKRPEGTSETTAIPSTAQTAATQTEAGAAKTAAAPIIRRRAKVDGTTETIAHGASSAAGMPSGFESQTQTPEEISTTPELSTQADFPPEYATSQTEFETQTAVQVSAEATDSDALPTAPSLVVEAQAFTEEKLQAPTPTIGATEVRAPRAPVVLAPRPMAPRKSFLKIVEPATPKGPTIVKAAPIVAPGKAPIKGTSTQDKEGFRIIRMTKENLDQMVEEEATKKKGGLRVGDINPADVHFADYRKKEMVFLPKRKKIPVGKELRKTAMTTSKAIKRIVEMHEHISIQDFAAQMNVKAVDVMRKLMKMGQMVTVHSVIDFDTAMLVAPEFQHEVKNVSFKEEEFFDASADTTEKLQPRPPVVTIMGHVDHGKTSLLDAIREANVAAGEAGGITQHIGAYTVTKDGRMITFIDTPGHEAFTMMRARGANVTDIVVLVVAADDGVMPQTREALSHAQAAGVPIVVAVNKIDKPGANPEKIKQGLSELNLLSEDWGGETMFIPVSALKKTNLDKLLEAILLQAEILDLKANSDVRASGTVLESRIVKGKGPMASVLVNRGTLRVGDALVSGANSGKVRAISNYLGQPVKEVGPGMACEVLGFESLPSGGEKFDSPVDESSARDIAEHRIDKGKAQQIALRQGLGKMSLDDLFAKIQAGNVKELNVILKTDMFGSAEAIRDSLLKLSTEKVKVKVILSSAGGITESDVMLASASSAVILGFNVRPETKARQIAEAEHVDIKCYSIIYELLDDIKKSMVGLLDKKKVERFLGRAEVRQTFTVPKIGTIGGSSVVDGKIIRGANVRLLRDSRVIYEGKMSSLKRFKDDAKEVAQGFECGIGLENYNDLKPGDLIEAYQIDLVAAELDAPLAASS